MIVTGFLLSTAAAFAQPAVTGTCNDWVEPHRYQGANVSERDPKIFGRTVQVPAMHIRVVDGTSGKPFESEQIRVVYGWRWLEYPYPEHGWGAWTETGDELTCGLDGEGWFETPQHLVRPRGWYNGVYTRWPWPRKPEFTEIEVVAITPLSGSVRLKIKQNDLSHFENADLVIRVFDGWRAEASWVSRQVLKPTCWKDSYRRLRLTA